jgi:hypothetical protein
MGRLQFQIVVYGGIADDSEPRVAADKVGEVLSGLSRDVQAICRNLSTDDDPTSLAERMAGCRIYVEGPPKKGQSLAFPAGTGDGAAEWGGRSMIAYASGIQEIRESEDPGSPAVPKGFDEDILHRVSRYCQDITKEHGGFYLDLPAANGTPPQRAMFDARLKTAVEFKLAAIAHATSVAAALPDKCLYGYSLQGVLFEMADPDYEKASGVVTVGINARDGRQWICQIDKELVPGIQELFRKEVLVTGDATFRPRKPILKARTIRRLPGVADPVRAMDELVALCGTSKREPLQVFMDRVRERD